MKTKKFFESRLQTPLRNAGWSWGSYNKRTKRIFLRIHEESVWEYEDGSQWAIIMASSWEGSSPGFPERLEHINLLQSGVPGYAIVYWTHIIDGKEKTKDFDRETLLVLGDVVEEDGITYVKIIGKISVDQVVEMRNSGVSTVEDIDEIYSQEIPETKRKSLVEARIGQGVFRQKVLQLWGH